MSTRTSQTLWRWIAALGLVLAMTVGASCGGNDDKPAGPSAETDLQGAFESFLDHGSEGETRRLVEMTNFQWDFVHYFQEGMTIDFMERVAGVPISLSDEQVAEAATAGSATLIFTTGSEQAAALVITRPVFLTADSSPGLAPNEAVVVITTANPGPYSDIVLQADMG